MKRLIAILTVALAFSLTACGNTRGNSSATENSNPQSSTSSGSSSVLTSSTDNSSEQGSQSESSTAHDNNDSSNILIAYFTAAENSGVDAVTSASYSMVNGEPIGRLRAIANMIQTETGGDLFSIRTSVVYPADGEELIDYAAEEQREDVRPELTSHIDDLDKYDTIFVGYPNWWADLHGASQWDGAFAPIAKNGVAVYIYMAENDEYYGSQKARDAYNGLYNAYLDRGFSDDEIDDKLNLEIPDNEYFNSRGIYNYHGGGNIVFDDKNVLNWIISHTKQE